MKTGIRRRIKRLVSSAGNDYGLLCLVCGSTIDSLSPRKSEWKRIHRHSETVRQRRLLEAMKVALENRTVDWCTLYEAVILLLEDNIRQRRIASATTS